MKQLKHPATLIAAVALFMALGGGAIAYAAVHINGALITNHTIASKKLTNAAVNQIEGNPHSKLVTFDATATSSTPVATPLGTFLGMTFAAACSTSAGDVTLSVIINTPDGSWNTDYASIFNDSTSNSSYTQHLVAPPGTISSPTPLTFHEAAGDAGTEWLDFYQVAPGAGEMVWNLTVETNPSPTCHFTVQYSADNMTAHTAAGHAPAAPRTTVSRIRNILQRH